MAGGLKRCFVMDGEMIGQQLTPGGSRVDFMTDAQGSVTGTVGSNGAVQKTYRFTPFGQFLSETGTGPDPDFRWNGVSQYYNTGLQHADYYVRARNYSSTEGRWTTADPLRPGNGPYALPPRGTASPAITLGRSINSELLLTPCGRTGLFWDFTISGYVGNGWLVQRIESYIVGSKCGGGEISLDQPCPTNYYWIYYEAFCVQSGVVQSFDPSTGTWGSKLPPDEWSRVGAPCSSGSITTTGDLMLLQGGPGCQGKPAPPQGLGYGDVPCAKGLPSGYHFAFSGGGGHGCWVDMWECCAPCKGVSCTFQNCPTQGPCGPPSCSVSPANEKNIFCHSNRCAHL